MKRPPWKQTALALPPLQGPTLTNFVGGGNAMLVQLLWRLGTGMAAPRRMHLVGPAGCGKSHLLHGAGTAVLQRGGTVHKVDIEAIPDVDDVCWRQSDLVIIDDLDVMRLEPDQAGRLVALDAHGYGAWLSASRTHPGSCPALVPDLASRLAADSFVVHPLDEHGRESALRAYARDRGIVLPEHIWRYLLARAERSMSELVALLDRMDRISLSEGRPITVPFVRTLLQPAQ
jgi:DnaA family protein